MQHLQIFKVICCLHRPSRSKHCSLCKCCIAKNDHHCVWINNCVGYLNHRYFLLFLISTTYYCLYIGYTSFKVLSFHVDTLASGAAEKKLQIIDSKTGTPLAMGRTVYWRVILDHFPATSGLCLFANLVGLLLSCFTMYHIYLAAVGVTSKLE